MNRYAHPKSLPFITFTVLSKGAPTPFQVPLTELPYRETSRFHSPLSTISQSTR